jgi:hypothetical protein
MALALRAREFVNADGGQFERKGFSPSSSWLRSNGRPSGCCFLRPPGRKSRADRRSKVLRSKAFGARKDWSRSQGGTGCRAERPGPCSIRLEHEPFYSHPEDLHIKSFANNSGYKTGVSTPSWRPSAANAASFSFSSCCLMRAGRELTPLGEPGRFFVGVGKGGVALPWPALNRLNGSGFLIRCVPLARAVLSVFLPRPSAMPNFRARSSRSSSAEPGTRQTGPDCPWRRGAASLGASSRVPFGTST